MGDAKRRAQSGGMKPVLGGRDDTNATTSVLAALVAPRPVQDFLTQYWPGGVFESHGNLARLPAFLRAEELSSVDALSRVYQGKLWFVAGRRHGMMLPIERVSGASLYRMGLTVQFEDIAPWIGAASGDLRSLERELGLSEGVARAVAFASPVSEGLGVHFDSCDLFSIQLNGCKRFHVAPVEGLSAPVGWQFTPGTPAPDELYAQAVHGFPDAQSARFRTVDMQPGSVLYLPRGTWHYTESEGHSLSVSISIFQPPVMDVVLNQIRLLMLQDARWRRPSHGLHADGAAKRELVDHVQGLIGELPELVARIGAADALAYQRPALQRLASLRPQDRFQRTSHTRLVVETAAAGGLGSMPWIHVKSWDANVGEVTVARAQLATAALPVMNWIAEQSGPFTADDLARRFSAFRLDDLRQLLHVAVESGLIRMLWFERNLRVDEGV